MSQHQQWCRRRELIPPAFPTQHMDGYVGGSLLVRQERGAIRVRRGRR